MRTTDIETVKKALQTYAEEIVGLDLEEWLANPLNIALTNEHGDVAMFEHQANLGSVVCAHYFFFSRGKKARDVAHKFLEELFSNPYPELLVGLTPESHKGALWMNRQLGVTEYGTVQTEIGPCRFVVLTKQQYLDFREGQQRKDSVE